MIIDNAKRAFAPHSETELEARHIWWLAVASRGPS